MTMHNPVLTIEFIGTPEAGKTTTILRLKEILSKNYKVSTIQESAERLPPTFPKNSMESNFWIRLETVQQLLEMQVSQNNFDFILIDRGIVDSHFWNYYYKNLGLLTSQQIDIASRFYSSIGIAFPHLVILLTTTPEEAIKRRGGEGHIVTIDFLKKFNLSLHSFIETVPCRVFELDTTHVSEDEVINILLRQIFSF